MMSLLGCCKPSDVEAKLDLRHAIAVAASGQPHDLSTQIRIVEQDIALTKSIHRTLAGYVIGADSAGAEEGLHGRQDQSFGTCSDKVDLISVGLHLDIGCSARLPFDPELHPG